MIRRIITIALAFVGLMVGAGIATGQETVQYFLSFGADGIWGVVLAGVIISISGLVILQLGSYYQAEDHSSVFESVAHKAIARFLDICVTVTVFALGFVMLAGAGSTMAQQFDWPLWVGSALMLGLVLLTGLLDIDKVTNVISYATPLVIIAIVFAFIYALAQLPVDMASMDQLAQQEPSPITPWWLSGINYAGLVLITAVSMVLVIGGNYLNPKEAGWGGVAGGVTLTVLLLLLALALLLNFDQVAGVPVPTLALFESVHPIFATIMVWIIYLMIYNSCIGQYYALGRRLAAKKPERFYLYYAGAAGLGFVISFIGFESLMTYVYPVLGYLGLILAAVLTIGYLRERPNIEMESERRIQIRALFTRQLHPDKKFTRRDARKLRQLVEASPAENDEMRETVREEVIAELDSDDSVDFEASDDDPGETTGASRATNG